MGYIEVDGIRRGERDPRDAPFPMPRIEPNPARDAALKAEMDREMRRVTAHMLIREAERMHEDPYLIDKLAPELHAITMHGPRYVAAVLQGIRETRPRGIRQFEVRAALLCVGYMLRERAKARVAA